MKQHISISDLEQLSKKGKERLRKWTKSRDYRLPIGVNAKTGNIKFTLPLLSIGQMIEFLDEQLYFDFFERFVKTHDGEWNYEDDNLLSHNYKELCDSLWQAVKEVLEK